MLSELLFAINPLNWDVNSLGIVFQPILFLIFVLVFAVLLLDITKLNMKLVTPNHGAALIISAFFLIRYFDSGLVTVVIAIIYFIFIAVKEGAQSTEKQMYTLSDKPRRRSRNTDDDDGTPIVVKIILIFFKACWYILSILPFNYLLLALEQFETPPNLILTYIGIIIMLFAVISLIGCRSDYKKQNDIDSEERSKKGYITTGKFKSTQSPVQFYEMLFFFGAVICGAMFYFGVWQWFFVLLSYLITRKMLLIRAGELEQFRKAILDNNTEYKKYSIRTSIFNPIFPKFTLLKPEKEVKQSKQTKEEPAQEGDEQEKGKKKRPDKKERPKKERPKKEKKGKKDKE